MNKETLRAEWETEECEVVATIEEEAMISDSRAGLTPAQLVERRLGSVLQSTPLPVSGVPVLGGRRTLA